MLWEGDIDTNQRRPILQRNTTSNYSHPAEKTKENAGEKERERWQVLNTDKTWLFGESENAMHCSAGEATGDEI